MQRRSNVATGVVFILVMVLHVLTVSTVFGATISIAEARQKPLHAKVTVEGFVTVYSGAFSSATFDQGFAVEDATAGIYVSVDIDLELDLDQKVRVTGKVETDGFGLLILKPQDINDVEVLPVLQQVTPQAFTTCEIGEITEGLLVQVVGTVTQPIVNDLPYGYKVFINSEPNDSSCEIKVFIHASTGINTSSIHQDHKYKVIGFSGEFTDPPGSPQDFEVDPRIASDIQPAQ
jgi:hypothetical protein